MSDSRARVEAALNAFNLPLDITTYPESTRTAEDAAAAIGCAVAQIVKSLVFKAKASDRAVLVLASGVNQVDEKKLKGLLGEKVGKADADFVRARTGFAIGGVAPVGHLDVGVILVDEDLLKLGELWAAAGTPNSVFRLPSDALLELTGAAAADIKRSR